MIVSFSVSNFRSFLAEETFSMAASSRLVGSHEDHALPIPNSDQRVLRAGVIYGANGAGKSNLWKALFYLQSIATGTRSKNSGTMREAFRLNKKTSEPSLFDLQFVVNEKLYRYGVKVDDTKIVEEWLVEKIAERERIIFERTTGNDGKVVVELPGFKKSAKKRLKLFALATIGGPSNQSFLATMKANLNSVDFGEEFENIIDWFTFSLKLISPTSRFSKLGSYLANNPDYLEFASTFLRTVSTGVDHLDVSVKKITEEEADKLLDTNFGSLKDLVLEKGERVEIPITEGEELSIDRSSDSPFQMVSVKSAHVIPDGGVVTFELEEESDGTIRLLNLIPALHGLDRSDNVYFIDEVDRSLHSNLVLEFLEFFLKSCSESHAQIIVTTHESNLLNLDLLRRDEIWFAEKDQSSATHLYALTDFKVRKDLEIRKHYLQGRFGAVPFFGNLEELMVSKFHNT